MPHKQARRFQQPGGFCAILLLSATALRSLLREEDLASSFDVIKVRACAMALGQRARTEAPDR